MITVFLRLTCINWGCWSLMWLLQIHSTFVNVRRTSVLWAVMKLSVSLKWVNQMNSSLKKRSKQCILFIYHWKNYVWFVCRANINNKKSSFEPEIGLAWECNSALTRSHGRRAASVSKNITNDDRCAFVEDKVSSRQNAVRPKVVRIPGEPLGRLDSLQGNRSQNTRTFFDLIQSHRFREGHLDTSANWECRFFQFRLDSIHVEQREALRETQQ